MSHTPEPWKVAAFSTHVYNDHYQVAICQMFDSDGDDLKNHEANALRIAACVNACAGIDNLVLQAIAGFGGMNQDNAVKAITKQRDELMFALKEIADDYADRFDLKDSRSTNPGIKYVIEQARAAIASAKGGA